MATVMSELLPEVDAVLENSLQRPLVGGKEVEASDGRTFETHDPGSGDVLATVPNLALKTSMPRSLPPNAHSINRAGRLSHRTSAARCCIVWLMKSNGGSTSSRS